MSPAGWSWAAGAVSVAPMVLTLRSRRWAWAATLAVQIILCPYDVWIGQPGFLLIGAVQTVTSVTGLWRSRQQRKEPR